MLNIVIKFYGIEVSLKQSLNVRNENAINNKRVNAENLVQSEFVSLLEKGC